MEDKLMSPALWVIPGDGNARDDGSLDAMAWREGEFTRPLYEVPSLISEIACRRRFQIAKGYDAAHDDKHVNGEIALAAAAYCLSAAQHPGKGIRQTPTWVPPAWPWHREQFDFVDARSSLLDAAAMIIAEIERLDRKD
jgi:hypothetical protein